MISAFAAAILAVVGLVVAPAAAFADHNTDIKITDVILTNTTHTTGQTIVNDQLTVTGKWDASDAEPKPGDTFNITLPPELDFPGNVSFDLKGADGTVWGRCTTSKSNGNAVCTLSDAVAEHPEDVKGTFTFDVLATETTTEKDVHFDLNGKDTPVTVPGDKGIGDGVVVPTDLKKSGVLNGNKWSMTWTIDIPGEKLQGNGAVHVSDTLGEGHQLCDPSGLKITAVRGNTSKDVTSLGSISTPGTKPGSDFDFVLNAPEGGWDPAYTYRIQYKTCTPDGRIDEPGTVYDNSAYVDVIGEGVDGVGVTQDWTYNAGASKSGSVVGGKDRNGKVRWTVTLAGEGLKKTDGINFEDTIGAGQKLCKPENVKIVQRKGPTSEADTDVTGQFDTTITPNGDRTAFSFKADIKSTSDFDFKGKPYYYLISYDTCATEEGLPAGGTKYSNTVKIGEKEITGGATVPGRNYAKSGNISDQTRTIDGKEHLPQTTIDWTVVIPGEKIDGVNSPLELVDDFGEDSAHQVCPAGDPGTATSRLNLKIQAQDQINGGGLQNVDLANKTTATVDGDNGGFKLSVDAPTLKLPNGSDFTGFSKEYQYVITYTTCTTSGGMDAKGTKYSNTLTGDGVNLSATKEQTYNASGTGEGVSRGSVAVSKDLTDNSAAALVPDGTKFTVHVKEFAPNKTTPEVEYDLQVPLNGGPVKGLNPRGKGWTIQLSEPKFPNVSGVVFADPTFTASDGVTVSQDGKVATATLTPATNIEVKLTNTAQLGQVAITKALTGGAADQVDAEKEYTVTAKINTSELGSNVPAQQDRTFTLKAGETNVLKDLPIGAKVTFSEAKPTDDDTFTWGEPTFDPETVTVTKDNVSTPAKVTLTNKVERTVGTFSLSKKVTGDEAGNGAVPETVKVTATWKDADGKDQSKDLTLPTDGTSVPFGENLLIGTEVTLTETPLTDGSGIVWSDPTWDGTGVEASGKSAVVTIGRDAKANVTLTNKTTTSTARISLIKKVTGDAADQAKGAEYTVKATWKIGDQDFSKELKINAETATDLGVDLPHGTVVTIAEQTPPTIDTVTWGSITIEGDGVTDKGKGVAEVVVKDQQDATSLVTVTNEATWATGTFDLSKTVTGDEADNEAVPAEVTVTATWTDPEGQEQSKELTVPTDGSTVDFGERLRFGTEVTLTETPLENGSGINWVAPQWTIADDDMVVDGLSARVTIGHETTAKVALENKATTSTAGISLIKGLSGEAAGEVDPKTEFPVTATWKIGDEEFSKELTINSVEPTELGEELPYGTLVTITEGEQPGIDTVVWGSIVITGDDVTDNEDGSATVKVKNLQDDSTLITVTNEATWAPGTFSLTKDVTGVAADNSDIPETVDVTATWYEGDEQQSENLSVPTDGSKVEFGQDLPHGTEVTLAETPLDAAPAFTWADPAWEAEGIVVNDDGTATITIGAAKDIDVKLTNQAVESLGSLDVTKTLSGDGADKVAKDTTFPVTATWTDIAGDEQTADLELKAGKASTLENLPLGTKVTLTEDDAEDTDVVKWIGAEWSSEDESVEISADGTKAVVTVTGDPGAKAAVTLDNEYEDVPETPTEEPTTEPSTDAGTTPATNPSGTPTDDGSDGPLASTGTSIGIGMVVLILALIGAGITLMARRRRTH
ncbi:DUF5979 domain-containing protein [Galactobacter sp.]|uniref:DUF5979 domain-containing protein n=1 Tax=Galactobacter sp. TaxID=2676125 RepID=UPI0025C5B2AE|nr:DUF5979 domain-containing protein [Galactobacter sp.]